MIEEVEGRREIQKMVFEFEIFLLKKFLIQTSKKEGFQMLKQLKSRQSFRFVRFLKLKFLEVRYATFMYVLLTILLLL